MNKMVFLVVLASMGCAEGVGNVALIGGVGRAGGGGDDGPSVSHAAPREVAPREVAVRSHPSRHDGDFVVCAQCRTR